jgi:hypothetical protein
VVTDFIVRVGEVVCQLCGRGRALSGVNGQPDNGCATAEPVNLNEAPSSGIY